MIKTKVKVAALLWLIVFVTLVFSAINTNVSFDASIMSLLPKSEQQPLAQQAIEQTAAGFSKRLLLLISGENESDVLDSVKEVAKSALELEFVSNVRWRVEDNQLDNLRSELFPYRFALLPAKIRGELKANEFERFEKRTLAKLFSPVVADKVELVSDPFGLYSDLSQDQKSDINIQISHSMLKVEGAPQATYLLLLTFDREPYGLDIQSTIMGFVNSQKVRLQSLNLALRSSGMILHAAAGANQARAEISSIGIGSLLGIIILLLVVFRQAKPIGLILLPISIGCITAISVTALVFDTIHLITLAFGAGLVGVSVDYALHFACERRYVAANKVIPNILPGLILGLVSSVLAYAVQVFAPFPGLQQMAVFSVVGLISSWLTVVLIFPILTKNDAIKPLPPALILMKLSNRLPLIGHHPMGILMLTVLAVCSLYVLYNSAAQDDIRLLQTSPDYLINQEQAIQKQLGTSSSTQFLLLECTSLQACLNKEQQLLPALNKLRNEQLIPNFQMLSARLPSIAQQKENYALVNALYKNQLGSLFKTLNLNVNKLAQSHAVFEQMEGNILTSQNWLTMQNSEAWRDLLVSDEPGNSATIIRFTGHLNYAAKSAVEALIESDHELTLVDQVTNISTLMKKYRTHVSLLLFIAYLALFVLLAWRYRWLALRVILPPLLASMFALTIITLYTGGINMFHLLALILVLGIGLDMGIFMAESGGSHHTWLAVSLSSLTSLLAFGLLAWSQTPVLHHFGSTVLIGLTLVWILTPMMRKDKLGNIGIKNGVSY